MLATDWTHFCEDLLASEPGKGVAFLLFDLPGYGANGGTPSPNAVLSGNVAGLKEALAQLGGHRMQVHILGHSIGAAVASQLAVTLSEKERMESGTLLITAPFLSVPHMAEIFTVALRQNSPTLTKMPNCIFRLIQLVVCRACPHRWDNSIMVPRAVKDGWKVTILHGKKDKMCPLEMGEKLCQMANEAATKSGAQEVKIHVQEKAGHNDLMRLAFSDYAQNMGFPKPRKPQPKAKAGEILAKSGDIRKAPQATPLQDLKVSSSTTAGERQVDLLPKDNDLDKILVQMASEDGHGVGAKSSPANSKSPQGANGKTHV
jgi:alpha-beta hydrolase superfamily lysophospholipase